MLQRVLLFLGFIYCWGVFAETSVPNALQVLPFLPYQQLPIEKPHFSGFAVPELINAQMGRPTIAATPDAVKVNNSERHSQDGKNAAPEPLPSWVKAIFIGGLVLLLMTLAMVFYLFQLSRGLAKAQAELRKVNAELSSKINQQQVVEDSLRKSERQFQYLAHFDYLTGLCNRRYFMQLAENEFTRINRYGGMLSLLMLDLDHFKVINDNYGHHSGDLVLQKFSAVCTEALRDVDIIGRLGGEEFAILLPETGEIEGVEVAERIRMLIVNAQVVLEDGDILQFTVSVGVASLSKTCTQLAKLFVEADQALYKAKAEGRNCVYPPPYLPVSLK